MLYNFSATAEKLVQIFELMSLVKNTIKNNDFFQNRGFWRLY
jgi:hypothetical protein